MSSEKLAVVFSPCLFQTQGQTPQETAVVDDLIRNYVALFAVGSDPSARRLLAVSCS